ncbi:MAG: hypothetical protein HWE08_04905 [Alphaproteobacteria bacterium]|nr:hypothetical protein [Alphaproteobacteria bacterium]
MKHLFKTAALVCALTFTQATFAPAFGEGGSGAPMDEAKMAEMVDAWYARTAALSMKGEAGIEDVMALAHPEMTYIHTEYDANMDRDGLIAGFKRRVARAVTRNSQSTITNRIAGKNMMAITRDTSHERRTNEGWKTRESKGLTTVFLFRDAKIWRITEYWD